MSRSQLVATVFVALVAGDVALSKAFTTDVGAPVERVSILSMLQVGPHVPSNKLVGGANEDCECAGTKLEGECTKEPTAASCTAKYRICESATSAEDKDVNVSDLADFEDCNADGCVSHDLRSTDPNCTEIPGNG